MTGPKLTADFFAGNRQRLQAQLPAGCIAIVAAHTSVQRSADTAFPFRQNSNFFYLTGLETPDCLLILTNSEEMLIAPDANALQQLWEGQPSLEDLQMTSGVEHIVEQKHSVAELKKIGRDAKVIYLPRLPKKLPFPLAINPGLNRPLELAKKHWPSKKVKDLRLMLARMRMVKQPIEIECIEQAIKITKEGLASAEKIMQSGISEYQLAAKLSYTYATRQAREAFPSIVAAGANACTIHYEGNKSTLKEGELVLFDVGAEYQNYAADISRTLPVGKIDKRRGDIHQAVLDAQQTAFDFLKPGVSIFESEEKVCASISDSLVKLGLLTKAQLRRDTQAFRRYYPHWPHSLGLDAHDAADYKQPFAVGMVVTVEPGIYIPEEGIGVRIEDDVLITKDGCRNLSA